MVTLGEAVLSQYRLFSLYNSPYPAHETGCAIDLYPPIGDPAPSPVSGTVVGVKTIVAPSRSYAAANDHLILINTTDGSPDGLLARVLHVDPTVKEGDHITRGDTIGTLVRSGYFAPWVDNHIHLGFRDRESNPIRASGSLKLRLGIDIDPVEWDGYGQVVESDDTYIMLSSPAHPRPRERYTGIAAGGGVLDGGCPHYSGGGLFGGDDGPVSLVDTRIGMAENGAVTWDDITVFANDTPITGISLGCFRDHLGVKLISWEGFTEDVGDEVSVTIARS